MPPRSLRGYPTVCAQTVDWGCVLKGRMRVKSAEGEELISAGDAFYLSPGHVPSFVEDIEVVEFSSKADYQTTLEVAARNIAAPAT